MTARQQCHISANRNRIGFRFALLIATALAIPATANAAEPIIRSFAAPRVYPRDELDRPRVTERQTHRGWEIHNERFTVVCESGQEDARLAAAQFETAWNETGRLFQAITQTAELEDFGLGAAEITISSETRHREEVRPTLQVSGAQLLLQLCVAPGQASLTNQLVAVHQAAAHSFIHATHLDRDLPQWVREGLAHHVAETLAEPTSNPNTARSASFDPDYWRRNRISVDQLEAPNDSAEGVAQVRFLLTGNDAQFAPAFLLALRDTVLNGNDAPAVEHRIGNRGVPVLSKNEPAALERLRESLQANYQAWRREPLAGQPILQPINEADVETLQLQKEMLVLLKLVARESHTRASQAGPKVQEFRDDKLQAVAAVEKSTARFGWEEFVERMVSDNVAPWATLDARGRVLFSFERRRITELLSPDNIDYSCETRDGHIVLARRLPTGQVLTGWLEPNPANAHRPLAKFQFAESSER